MRPISEVWFDIEGFCFRTIERSRLKCGQYWPMEEETAEDYGDYVIINNGIDRRKDYIVTSLILQNTKVGNILIK